MTQGTATRLVADIGGTRARFALAGRDGVPFDERTLLVRDHEGPAAAALAYLDGRKVEEAVFAVATPVEDDEIAFVNSPWRFSLSAMPGMLGVRTFVAINDFVAQALALPHLPERDLERIGGGEAAPDRPLAVIGPGTGLGVSALVPCEDHWIPIASEGGHASFAPADEREAEILLELHRRFDHVSKERLLSGPGLLALAQAIAATDGATLAATTPEAVTRDAKAGTCPVAAEAITRFSAILGAAAGDLALTFGARGGVYVCGGVCQRLGPLFDARRFRERFEHKGRLSPWLARVPTWLVRNENAGLIGAAHHHLGR